MTTTTTLNHTAAVAAIYEAFGRGDVAAVLGHLSPEVTWDGDWADNWGQDGSLPHFLPRRGHDAVREFFHALSAYTLHDLQVHDLLAGDGQVVAQVTIELTTPSGGRLRDEELHLWTFGPDGSVSALRHYIDTAKHLEAGKGIDTTAGRPARA